MQTHSVSDHGFTPLPNALSEDSIPVPLSVVGNGSHALQPSFSLITWLRENIWMIGFGLWGGVATVLTTRLLVGLACVRRSIHKSLPAPSHLQRTLTRVLGDLDCSRRVGLRISPDLGVPFLAGLRSSVIVLPNRMTGDEYADASPAILAHEVTHLCSGDLLWMFVAKWISALLWFHPLIWKLGAAHSAACEEVCDAVAADYVGNTELYSSALARVALETMGAGLAIGVIPLVRSSDILTRLRLLKRKVCSQPLAGRWVALSILIGMVIVMCLGGVKLVRAQANQTSSVAESVLPGFGEIDVAFGPEQAKGKRLLVCFWDMQQRPSRNLLIELAGKRNELEDKGIVVLLVHSAGIKTEQLQGWIDKNKIPFISGRIVNDIPQVLHRWRVRAQPWLVLTNDKADILAGGFELGQLDETLLDERPAVSRKRQESKLSDTMTLKLVDSNGVPVSGAKVGTHVNSRGVTTSNSFLKISLGGYASKMSNLHGEITLTPKKLAHPSWPVYRKIGLYILHEERKIGAVCEIARDDFRKAIELTLVPVCHVYGKLESKDLKRVGRPLTWTWAHLSWNRDSDQIMSHPSEEQEKRFAFLAPPGVYQLFAYGGGDGADTKFVRPIIEVKPGQSELDMGVIDLPSTKSSVLIGRQAPEIGPIKAWKNGAPVRLSQLKGKAVIIHFGGKAPSTNQSLRRLVELHEEFENKGLAIIALYNSTSMAALEREWKRNYERYGGEPEVPFRIAVDGGESSFYERTGKIRLGATYAIYGITGTTNILIDPDGKVAGQFHYSDIREKLGAVLGITIKPERRTRTRR